MCGIALVLLDSSEAREGSPLGNYTTLWESLCSVCADRGPDCVDSTQLSLTGDGQQNGLNAFICASVLHLRGPDGRQGLTRQPHIGPDGSIFVWNGEIFEGLPIGNHENDGQKLFDMIQNTQGDITSLTHILSQLEGPYAFMYLHKPSQTLYFARDPLGRRSLLIHLPTLSEPVWILCSASSRIRDIEYQEISTAGIFSISLNEENLLKCAKTMTCAPRGASMFEGRMALNSEIPPDPPSIGFVEQIEDFISKLDESVKSRVSNIPSNNVDTRLGEKPAARLGILFSGGIDCSVIAYLADRHIPRGEPIDLLNVAFENPRALSGPQKNAIQEARAQRKRNKKERKEGASVTPSEVQSPVAVEEPLKTGIYDVPDRLTGLEEVEELSRLCPDRQWNFVCVNVPYEECKREEPRVLRLMYPSKTVMDLSLALALYFASRGKGILYRPESSNTEEVYSSPAKVLLSGLGSDELLGGYSRHRQAYSKGGWDALISELQLDLDRLPTRNLGRDDRVISAHGRESRYPFLSLTFVSYLARLPVQVKVDPRLTSQTGVLGAGMGDKTLLRLAAQHLGLELASRRVKRAMQFGSRSARMDGGSAEKKGHFLLE